MDMRSAYLSVRTGLIRRWQFDGNPKNLAIGALSAAGLTLVFLAFQGLRIVEVGYGPPMVVLTAYVANRLGLRSGLICAITGTVCLEYFFYGDQTFFNQWPSAIKVSVYASMVGAAVLLARQRTEPVSRILDRDGQNLPFTRSDGQERGNGGIHGTGMIWWDAESTGIWGDDAQIGSEYLRILANRIEAGEPAPMLPWIIHDMIRAGKWTGVEAGFSSALGWLAFRRHRPGSSEPPQQS